MHSDITDSRVHEQLHGRSAGLDFLRILACIAVVLYHLTFRGNAPDCFLVPRFDGVGEITRYGFLGVELFFIISGYAIWSAAQGKGAVTFAFLRFVRLAPAFWICCTLTYLVVTNPIHSVDFTTYLLNMTMLGGLIKARPVDTSYWSLFVEFHFYFLVLLAIAARATKHGLPLGIAWLALTIALLLQPITTLNFFFIPYWSSLFISGMAIWAIRHSESKRVAMLLFAGSAAVSMHLIAGRAEQLSTFFGTTINTLVVQVSLLTCLILVLLLTRPIHFKGARSLTLCAGATYPMYLLHQNVGYTLINHFGTALGPISALSIALAIIVVSSFVIHLLVESPLQRFAKLLCVPKNVRQ